MGRIKHRGVDIDEEDAEVLRFDNLDNAVECCADLGIPFFLDAGNKKLVFWFVRVDDEGVRLENGFSHVKRIELNEWLHPSQLTH
ncbi:TPA: hypothetical protein ACXKGF_005173 [Escherichia coli]